MNADILTLPALITEASAYEKYREILEDKELRRARVEGRLGFYVRKGKILYREDELVRFIAGRLNESYTPPECEKNPNSGSVDIGSTEFPVPTGGTVFGMTPELEKSAGELLERQILKPPRSRSPRSS